MKVIVLGAGVIGISTAYFLRKAGHEVIVVDRQDGAGLETSFANGGQLSASHAAPWASPEVPWLLLKWLGRSDAPLLYRLRFDPSLWAWTLRFLANCRAARVGVNTMRNLSLALYSRDCMAEIQDETGITFARKELGILEVFRNPDELDVAASHAVVLRDAGCDSRRLDRDELIALEPALEATGQDLAGAIHTPGDDTGDAHLFTRNLAALLAERGVTFHYGTSVQALVSSGNRIGGVETLDQGFLAGDAYVLSLGSYSPLLLKPHGIRLPVYPTKGYSITLPTDGYNGAPQISVTDMDRRLVFTRLDERLRVAGTAEFAGYDSSLDKKRAVSLLAAVQSQFPGAGDFDKTEFWAGLRPLTPDGVPVIGPTRFENLFLNTGHGTLGWTHCAASGRLAADLIGGVQPDIDVSAYSLARF